MHAVPYWRLAGFYFFYFAYLGTFAPYFSLYLAAIGLAAFEIGVLMALPQAMRILAPNVWGWLADRSGRRIHVARVTGVAGTAAFAGVFTGDGFMWLFAVLLAMSFLWSAALPLTEVTTLNHLRGTIARYGRIRVWGSLGFIAGVIVVGAVLDIAPITVLLPIVLGLMLAMLGFLWSVPEAGAAAAAHDERSIGAVLKQPPVIALIAACSLMAVAHGPYYTFYSLHLVANGYTKTAVGWLWALGVICEIGVFVWLPHLYRAFTLERILVASFWLAAIRFLLIGWASDSLPLLVLAQALHAATFGAFHAASVGLVQRFFTGRHQARGQALYGSLSYGLGGTIGALGAGAAWEPLGAAWTFTLAGACAVTGAVIVSGWLRSKPS